MITYEQIAAILKGMDQCETDDPKGWWEVSCQAEFGAEKIAEIKALFDAEESKTLGKSKERV